MGKKKKLLETKNIKPLNVFAEEIEKKKIKKNEGRIMFTRSLENTSEFVKIPKELRKEVAEEIEKDSKRKDFFIDVEHYDRHIADEIVKSAFNRILKKRMRR